MLIDTDILIWFLRSHPAAARFLDGLPARNLSVVSFMELLQGARDRQELRRIKSFLFSFGFEIVSLSENIGHRAAIYMEEYGLSGGLTMPDALIAATAVDRNLPLATGNRKHFTAVRELRVVPFRI
jgi:predicted nucleic acid-binding protein